MNVTVLFFGITTDLVETSETVFSLDKKVTVKDFKQLLIEKYPNLTNLTTYAIAVNEAYATDSILLADGDVVAVIPPVSGG
ncbi:molybdopterin converting factor subunit 1 [Polaribacter tangerinus]|uniref:molybdopterin converting factor subunit 1 n=1 Tax=Polaribacter tangerinus TaxID=1920034 RepID=UPI000B4B5F6D|nr:molybdopterin converting factor subunit 1 [Polaribacter tangerinus]